MWLWFWKQTQHGEQSWLCRCCWPRTCHLRDNCKVFVNCFILILNNNDNNIALSPLKKGWRSFHQSTKEPSRKICVLTIRNLLDIASESIVLKIFWYWLLFYKKVLFSHYVWLLNFRWAGLDLKGTTLKKFMIFNITNPEVESYYYWTPSQISRMYGKVKRLFWKKLAHLLTGERDVDIILNCCITAVRALVWNNGTLLCKIDFNRNLSF